MFLLKIISKKIEKLKERRNYRRERRFANSRRKGYYYLKKSDKLKAERPI